MHGDWASTSTQQPSYPKYKAEKQEDKQQPSYNYSAQNNNQKYKWSSTNIRKSRGVPFGGSRFYFFLLRKKRLSEKIINKTWVKIVFLFLLTPQEMRPIPHG